MPTSVGGNSWGLSQAEKKLGIDSVVLTDTSNWLNYNSDICLFQEKETRLHKMHKRLAAFYKYRSQFDIYHFNFGSSLIDFQEFGLNLIDLPFYSGKKVMTYNGSDARQNLNLLLGKYYGEIYCNKEYGDPYKNKIKRKRIKKVEKYVDHIFSLNPDLMYFLPKKTTFLPYTIAGWHNIKRLPYNIKDKIKIVHSPTNRLLKGSKYIIDALNKLKRKYDYIEIEIIEHMSYEDALKKYQEAHLIIDQVLIGWYGAFGVEVMKMGKPLAVFIREEDLHFIPQQMATDLKKSIINIDKNNIYDVLDMYIRNSDMLYQKGDAGYDYVNKWHNPIKVAKIVKNIYEKL